MRKRIDVRLELRLQEYEQQQHESLASAKAGIPVIKGMTDYSKFREIVIIGHPKRYRH